MVTVGAQMVDVDRLISFGKSLSELVDFVAPQQAVQPAVRTLRLELGKAPSRSQNRIHNRGEVDMYRQVGSISVVSKPHSSLY